MSWHAVCCHLSESGVVLSPHTMQLPKTLAIRKNFEPTTWLLAGACLQFLFVLVLPRYVAFLPAACLLTARLIGISTKAAQPVTLAAKQSAVHRGRYTAQLPNKSGSEVVLFIIGASVNKYALHTVTLMSRQANAAYANVEK